MANDYLPKDYEPPVNDFMKLSEGDNEIRILSKPLIGKIWWESPEGEVRTKGQVRKGDKPQRIDYKTPVPEKAEDGAREFWMLKVLDYKVTKVRILEITQASIIGALNEYIENKKWGDPREYDINLKREGTGKETKYFVMPSPQEPLSDDMQLIADNSNVDLNKYITSDPFEGMDIEDEEPVDTTEQVEEEEEEEAINEEEDLPF